MSRLSEFVGGDAIEVHASPYVEVHKPRYSLDALLKAGAKVVTILGIAIVAMAAAPAHAESMSGGIELKTGGAGVAVGAASSAVEIVNQFHNGPAGARAAAFNHAELAARTAGAVQVNLASATAGKSYRGTVVAVVDGYVVQNAGRGTMVIHNAGNLGMHPAVGQSISVRYQANGQGLTTPNPVAGLALGGGLVR